MQIEQRHQQEIKFLTINNQELYEQTQRLNKENTDLVDKLNKMGRELTKQKEVNVIINM